MRNKISLFIALFFCIQLSAQKKGELDSIVKSMTTVEKIDFISGYIEIACRR
jgi:hypothetical protein